MDNKTSTHANTVDARLKYLLLGDRHDPATLMCPTCGYMYTCFDDQVTTYDDGRDSILVIPMRCELDHTFQLRLSFHKGETHISTEPAKVVSLSTEECTALEELSKASGKSTLNGVLAKLTREINDDD